MTSSRPWLATDPNLMEPVGTPPQSRFRPWTTWAALATIWCAALLDQLWVLSLLLMAWAHYDIRTGESLFIQRITRRHQPVTYWIIVATWISFGVLGILYQ